MEQQQHRLFKHQQHGCQEQQHRQQNSSNTSSCNGNKATQQKMVLKNRKQIFLCL